MSKTVIVGAGVAGIFTALQMLENGEEGANITIIDKGKELNKRSCFVEQGELCKKCKVCSITHGIGGTGSYSDSKLNFDESGKVGGNLAELMTPNEIKTMLYEVYDKYVQFGIDKYNCKVYGADLSDKAKEIINIIDKSDKMTIAQCNTIHLGNEISREIYGCMIDYLNSKGIIIHSNYEIEEIKKIDAFYKISIKGKKSLIADNVVFAMGRAGNDKIKEICDSLNIECIPGGIDIGVRVECKDEVMNNLNNNFYEAKIYFDNLFNDDVRMFCTNPGGFVATESYEFNDTRLFTANGYAYSNKKSGNTNFALLVTRHFNGDMADPLNDYVFPVIRTTNALGKGAVIVQSLKDIRAYRRSTDQRISWLNIEPTMKAYAGDITSALPYRTLSAILQALEELDKICPGVNGDDTLLYAPEAKFHSNKVKINKYGATNKKGIYFIGDCSGYTRGITSAASMGIMCANNITGGK